MNIKNINSAIAIMSRHMEADHILDMATWQSFPTKRPALAILKEEHLCGTPCCVAGYIAVSPEFQADGGGCRKYSGSPELNDHNDSDAIREWLGCSNMQAEALCGFEDDVGVAYPDKNVDYLEYSDVIATLVSLRDTGKLPGEIIQ